jgi:hypothetical protein
LAVVAHLHADRGFILLGQDPDKPAPGCVAQGIGHQVGEDPEDLIGVGQHRRQLRRQFRGKGDGQLLGLGPNGFQGLLHDWGQQGCPDLHRELPGFHPGQVEQVVDQSAQSAQVLLRVSQQLPFLMNSLLSWSSSFNRVTSRSSSTAPWILPGLCWIGEMRNW